MWNEPTDEDLKRLPSLYASDELKAQDMMIHMHFFLGGSDWYAAEYSSQESIFFGYAILNDDMDNAEWGYMSFDELRRTKTSQGFEIDRDLHWKPRSAGEVEKIVEAEGRQGHW